MSTPPADTDGQRLAEGRLADGPYGVIDSVTVGLGSMLGAGLFVGYAPAARAAGSGLLISLVLAAGVAYCNAASSAHLASRLPTARDRYAYADERLGPLWGYLASWCLVVARTAACAAVALTAGAYGWPEHARTAAVVAVVLITALACLGARRGRWATRVMVVVALLVLAAVVVGCAASGRADAGRLRFAPDMTTEGVLQGAGMLFFAFAGYASTGRLGREVRASRRRARRVIPLTLAVLTVAYLAAAAVAVTVLGSGGVAGSAAPLVDAVSAADLPSLGPVVRVGAAAAALGALLPLVLGIPRTVLAVVADHGLPRSATGAPLGGALFAGAPVRLGRLAVPHPGELAVGAVVLVLVATVDLAGAVSFASFGVLLYHALANASAWTLRTDLPPAGAAPPAVSFASRTAPVLGFAGSLLLAFSLPLVSVLLGTVVVGGGAAAYAAGQRPA